MDIKPLSSARDRAVARSHGHCEAMIEVRPSIWTRCGVNVYEVHHALTRARGGAVLDQAGEYYHLIVLCHKHHRMADGDPDKLAGLLIDGYAITENGKPVYYGTDPYLRSKYGKDASVK